MKKAKRFIRTWSASEMALIEQVKQYFLVQEHDVKGLNIASGAQVLPIVLRKSWTSLMMKAKAKEQGQQQQ